jgi:hypothetical protein
MIQGAYPAGHMVLGYLTRKAWIFTPREVVTESWYLHAGRSLNPNPHQTVYPDAEDAVAGALLTHAMVDHCTPEFFAFRNFFSHTLNLLPRFVSQ